MACKIGVLGVQGAFTEHRAALLRASRLMAAPVTLEICDVRTPSGITDDLDGFIIPGGESTVISMFLQRNNMDVPLKAWTQKPQHVTWGTCAGMILLAEKSVHQKEGGQPQIGGLDVVVSRNYFGRQVDSFEAEVQLGEVPLLRRRRESGEGEGTTCRGVFIRAPVVMEISDPDVQVLATLQHSDQRPLVVAVKQGNLMATAFHPELTDDPTWHLFFIQTVLRNKIRAEDTESTS